MDRGYRWAFFLLFALSLSACVEETASENSDSTTPESTTYSLSAEVLELAKRSGCLACHAVEKKVVGPAWVDVARKYEGDATAPGRLVDKVKSGGKGVWGEVPMPPYSPRVPDADITLLVASILGAGVGDVGTVPPGSMNGTVAAGASVEHNVFLIEGGVYSVIANASIGDVDVAVYAIDSTGARVLIEASQERGLSEQMTLSASMTGTHVIVVTGYLESQYTLSVDAFDKAQFLELAKASGCLACHSIEKKVVGPAFGAVAAKYRGDAGAKVALMAKVAAGGKGVWGEVPMPPYSPRVPDDDIERLVVFLLTLPDAANEPVPTPQPTPAEPIEPPARPAPVSRDQFLDLAKKNGCLACHAIEKRVVGPAWLDVANHYRDATDAYRTLFNKVRIGGKGVWGEVPMPPYSPRVPDASIAQLVANILALGGSSTLPLPNGSWSISGSVMQGETDLVSFVGEGWTLYTIELESVTGDADLTVYAVPEGSATRSMVGKSDSKQPLDHVSFSTEAVSDNYDVEAYGYLSSDYGLTVRAEALVFPDPQPPTAEQFKNYAYTLSDATLVRAKAAGCLACHAQATRVIGPSFKVISLRFKDVAGSKERLIAKVKDGGKGYWGEIPMPPYAPRVLDADIEALVQSILFGDSTAP